MNKGVFAHIVATILYCILTLFIIQGENIGLGSRSLIVTLLLFTNFIICAISDIENWYHQKV